MLLAIGVTSSIPKRLNIAASVAVTVRTRRMLFVLSERFPDKTCCRPEIRSVILLKYAKVRVTFDCIKESYGCHEGIGIIPNLGIIASKILW